MVDFILAIWEEIVINWNIFWGTMDLWIYKAFETIKAIGISGIVLIILRYVMPLLKNVSKPILAKIGDINKEILDLKTIITNRMVEIESQLDANAVEAKKVNELFIKYMSLSCQTNSKSRTLSPEQIRAYKELGASFKELGKEALGQAIIDATKDGVITEDEDQLIMLASQEFAEDQVDTEEVNTIVTYENELPIEKTDVDSLRETLTPRE